MLSSSAGRTTGGPNRSTEPALVAFVLIDGTFTDELRAALPRGALERGMERPAK
jgi:hypothetical protein